MILILSEFSIFGFLSGYQVSEQLRKNYQKKVITRQAIFCCFFWFLFPEFHVVFIFSHFKQEWYGKENYLALCLKGNEMHGYSSVLWK